MGRHVSDRGHRASLALCGASRDACDALVAALAARAAAIGVCEPIPDEYRRLAEVEGWIALPKAKSLNWLLGANAGTV
jgi:uncharacterized protein with LGFP repeats